MQERTPVFFYSASYVLNGQKQHSHGCFTYGGDAMRIINAIEQIVAGDDPKINPRSIAIHSVSHIPHW
jgi:hypothetical protein